MNLERKFWCFKFFYKANLKILIFDLAYWSRNFLFVFEKNKIFYQNYLTFRWFDPIGDKALDKKDLTTGFWGKEASNLKMECSEKGLPCWLSQFSFAIAKLLWKMQRKTWYSILGLDVMPLSLKNLLLRNFLVQALIFT